MRIALSHVRVFVRAIGLRGHSRSICRSFSRARCSSLQLVQWDSASPTSPSDRDELGLNGVGLEPVTPQLVEHVWYFATVRRLGRTARLKPFVTRTFATRRGGRPPFLSAILPLESQKSLSRRPPGRRARILRRPRHFLVDQQCSEMRLRSSGLSASANRRLPTIPQASRSGQNFVALRHHADRRPAGKLSPDVRHVHRQRPQGSAVGMAETPRPKVPTLSPRRPLPGVPTGSPCVLVLGLCGLCRSNCRTMGLLHARRCDA